MRIYPGQVIPLFVGDGSLGSSGAPQIRFFDVYYVNPPVVGLQVVGSEED